MLRSVDTYNVIVERRWRSFPIAGRFGRLMLDAQNRLVGSERILVSTWSASAPGSSHVPLPFKNPESSQAGWCGAHNVAVKFTSKVPPPAAVRLIEAQANVPRSLGADVEQPAACAGRPPDPPGVHPRLIRAGVQALDSSDSR